MSPGQPGACGTGDIRFSLVDEVVYQHSLIEKLSANLQKISFVLGIFIALLLFISFVLINNTVRLNVFSKRLQSTP